MRPSDDDDDQGMDTTGEIRRKEAEEFARQQREERERLVEAEREKEALLLFSWVEVIG
jgi:hypothetical protein